MPLPVFFQQLGLFISPDFLDPAYRLELCRHIAVAPVEKASVARPFQTGHVDQASRRVGCCNLPQEAKKPLEQRLAGIRPSLEKHFGVSLSEYEPPDYLIYNAGDFFEMHRDSGRYGSEEIIRRRRVSVVVFLNRQSGSPAEDAYGDGDLTFYGLLEGPQWEKCGFPLKAEPGMLVAFLSEKLHEVKPVSHGRRFSVATWFLAPETQPLPL
jgi:SM-20-related protein